jgi:hypothetical protein
MPRSIRFSIFLQKTCPPSSIHLSLRHRIPRSIRFSIFLQQAPPNSMHLSLRHRIRTIVFQTGLLSSIHLFFHHHIPCPISPFLHQTPPPRSSTSPPPPSTKTHPLVPIPQVGVTPKVIPKKKRKTRQKSAMLNTPSQGKKLLRELKRKQHLQNDEFILSCTETTATCAACMMVYKLDKRNGARYYVSFWEKHRERCKEIKEMVSHFLLPLKENCALKFVVLD